MKTENQHNKPYNLGDKSSKNTFSVPDGYFDKLPTIIQTKAIERTRSTSIFSTVGVLKLALPTLLLLITVGYWGFKYQQTSIDQDAEIKEMLSEISTEEMVNYLNETDLSSDDLLDLVSFEGERIDDFSLDLDNVSDEELELLINEFEIEDINNI